MVTNVSVKFDYDRLRIDKALGNFSKSDNNITRRTRTMFVALGDPYPEKTELYKNIRKRERERERERGREKLLFFITP